MSLSNDSQPAGLSRNDHFVTTHWSLVLKAQQNNSLQAERALAELCRTYWYPLYSFVRRQGQSPENAEDLTQEFFAQLLQKNYLAAVRQEKGKFRSFLLMALKRFLAKQWEREHAQKRGGRVSLVSFNADQAESRYGSEPANNLTPDLAFERQWVSVLLEQVMARLRQEHESSGRCELFGELKGAIARDKDAASYLELGARLGMSEAAVKMAVQRLRRRYRELLREEIGKTVAEPEEIEEELQHLFLTFNQ
jgi:RNA polymerase sigma factor (sigma-70 family)